MTDNTPKAIEDCHDLLRWMIPHLDKFPRNHRFTLGERLESALLQVLEALVAAAYSRDKRADLELANRKINVGYFCPSPRKGEAKDGVRSCNHAYIASAIHSSVVTHNGNAASAIVNGCQMPALNRSPTGCQQNSEGRRRTSPEVGNRDRRDGAVRARW